MQKRNSKFLRSASFHIILEVDDKFTAKVEQVSSEIQKKYDSDFVVGENYRTHATLYLFSAPIRNILQMKKKAKVLSKIVEPVEIKTGDLILSYDGWLMISIQNPKLMTKYHLECVKLFNPLREGLLREKYRNVDFLNLQPQKERESLLKFGDRHAGNLFHPHFSISHITNLNEAQVAYFEFKKRFKNDVTKIKSLKLVMERLNESGGIGKVFFKHDFYQ